MNKKVAAHCCGSFAEGVRRALFSEARGRGGVVDSLFPEFSETIMSRLLWHEKARGAVRAEHILNFPLYLLLGAIVRIHPNM